MKLEMTVVSRVESMGKDGVIGWGIVLVAALGDIPAKLEIGLLPKGQEQSFVVGRVVTVTIPTYHNSKPEVVPEPE